MTVYRLIAPQWLIDEGVEKRVLEGIFTWEEVLAYNHIGYNVYSVPNHPKSYHVGTALTGGIIDSFDYVFVDCDLKDKVYSSKDDFISALSEVPTPSRVVDSGNGVHAYWKVSDLDPMSYLRLSKRLMRKLRTDPRVGQIFQLMRCPGTMNTKKKDNPVPCELLFESGIIYTAEELDKVLPPITPEDERACIVHFDKTYNTNKENIKLDVKMPVKWGKLLRENDEVKSLWTNVHEDRSGADYRLGHIMFANGFTKTEAVAVLSNSAKASSRAPIHRMSYATGIVDKIWTFELEPDSEEAKSLSSSIREILQKTKDTSKGDRFACHKCIDNTEYGFRLGHVIGLVAGSGVGKTAVALNMFQWFAKENPSFHHFFVPLEQPAHEIAYRWQKMCGEDTRLHDKVHVLSNYDDDGNFRHLSLADIEKYILDWQERTGNKVGCIVIDHIGALKKKGSKDEKQDLVDICHAMKGFAVRTNTLLVMQSQTSREKAGVGDLELNKDAAYGTMYFEAYCDYLITIWQPLKRMHSHPNCPTVTAYKFCKIRHKNARKDLIQEDVPYYLYFDSETEQLKEMTQDQIIQFDFFVKQATNKRKVDRKTEVVIYQSVPWNKKETDGTDAQSSIRSSRN